MGAIILLLVIVVAFIISANKNRPAEMVTPEINNPLNPQGMQRSNEWKKIEEKPNIDEWACRMYREVMGYNYVPYLQLYPEIPFQSSYFDMSSFDFDSQFNPTMFFKYTNNSYDEDDYDIDEPTPKIVINLLFPEIYRAYLRGERYSIISEQKLSKLCKKFEIGIYHYIYTHDEEEIQRCKNIWMENQSKIAVEKERREYEYWNKGVCQYKDVSWLRNFSDLNLPKPQISGQVALHRFYEKYLIPEIQIAWQQCPNIFSKRINSLDPQYVYNYRAGQVTPKNDIEELELKYFLANRKEAVDVEEKKAYENEDMQRIKQILDSIPNKIAEINRFSQHLKNTIVEYKRKGSRTIEAAYGNILKNNNISGDYFNKYDEMFKQFTYEINPVVAAACDASIKKIYAFIKQKEDIIAKNNSDIVKYNQLLQRLQKQYDDEFALQKIKEINKDVNLQMEDVTDIAQKEETNYAIQNIISDINMLDKEVNERRQYEIQFGQIEI